MKKIKELYANRLKDMPHFTTDINVRWEEMDVNGHINYAAYLDYYSEARIEAVGQELFLSLREEGIGPAIYKAEIDFINELFHPDRVHIVTYVDESIGKTRVSVIQEMYSHKKEALISKARFFAIFMNSKNRKPVRMPQAIREKFGLK
ncbi:MAG: thioesterase family protein [Spirochaetia bacterium]|nr:thioesterase family protein [Spirochaetia bacterium]